MASYATINEAYGKEFSKKKKKDKKGKKKSACHYYARRYAENQKEAEPFNLDGLDNNDVFSKYDKNAPDVSYDLYANRQDFIKANKDNLKNCDIKEEEDYFEKLYDEHDFRPMMSRDGDNIMSVEPTEYEEVKFDNRIKRDIKSSLSMDLEYESDDDTESVGTSMVAQKGTEVGTEVGTIVGTKVGSKVGSKVSKDSDKVYESDKNYMDLGLYLISGILLIFILEQFVQIGLMMRETRGGARVGGSYNYVRDFNYQMPPQQYFHPAMYGQMYPSPQMYNPPSFTKE